MLLSKRKTVISVLVLFVVAGAGPCSNRAQAAEGAAIQAGYLIAGSAATLQAETTSKPSAAKVVDPSDLVKTYQTNTARANEKYTNMRVAVKGRLLRIRDRTPLAGYILEMAAGRISDAQTNISFHFTAKDQKQLAQLEQFQELTIEGICEGWRLYGEGLEFVSFRDCKILEVSKDRVVAPPSPRTP